MDLVRRMSRQKHFRMLSSYDHLKAEEVMKILASETPVRRQASTEWLA